MAAESTVKVVFLGDTKDFKRAASDVDDTAGKLSGSFSRISETAAGVFAGGAMLAGVEQLGGFLLGAAKAAAEDEAASERLATTMRNAVAATDEQIAAAERWIDTTQRATGVADDQLRPALAILVRSTGDVESAQKQLNLAMDVAQGTGKDLETVATALAKANEGGAAALARMIPELSGVVREGASADEVMQQLAATFGGQAAQHAETFEGKMARLNVAWGEAQEKLGEKLLPVLTELATWLAEKGIPYAEAFSAKVAEIVKGVDDWFKSSDGGKPIIDGLKESVDAMVKSLEILRDMLAPVVDLLERGVKAAGGWGQVFKAASVVGKAGGLGGLGGLISFPGFAAGGTVPGPYGQPQLVIAHGGEEWPGLDGGVRSSNPMAGSRGAGVHIENLNVSTWDASQAQIAARAVADEIRRQLAEVA